MMFDRQKEAETIRERTFKIELSDADVDRLAMKAAVAGMSMGELLASFVGDLVCGTRSNGSDERMYAERWFDRCGYPHFPVNDIARLAGMDMLEEMVESCAEYREAIDTLMDVRMDYETPDCDDVTEDDVKDAEVYLDDCKRNIKEIMDRAKCTGTFDEVVSVVEEWKKNLTEFKATF